MLLRSAESIGSSVSPGGFRWFGTAAWLVAALLAGSCGGGGKQGTPEDIGPELVADLTGETADSLGCLADAPLLDTKLPSGEAVLAGEPVEVSCLLENCPDAELEGTGIVVAGIEGEDFQVSGSTVTFLKPGEYEVACTWTAPDGGQVQDPTPAVASVQPGQAVLVLTELSEKKVKAGTQVVATCSAFDAMDNPVYGAFTLAVNPASGTVVGGLSLTPTAVGEYEVACVLDGAHSGSPAKLVVEAGVPRRLVTTLNPDTVPAGKGAGISCQATDLWGNKVAGFPMVVFTPPEVTLQGLSVSSTLTGSHLVKCVPQAEDWALFELVGAVLKVVPGPPMKVELTPVPDKPVYKVLDKLWLQVAVRDEFGNLVPDAALAPVEVSPPEGVVETQPWHFKFTTEGKRTLSVKLADALNLGAQLTVLVDGSGPLLAVDYPERGATLTDKPSVTVTGSVSDSVTGLSEFFINGKAAEVGQDNSFSHIVLAKHAVNLLVAEALDEGGQTTRTVRSFAYSDKYYPTTGELSKTHVPDGLQLFLADEFVDDGAHDPANPDDLATLMEVMLANLDFGSLIPNPVYNANSYKVFVKNVKMDAPFVQMSLVDGGLKLNAWFKNLSADVDAIGTCKVIVIDLCPDVSGTLHVDQVNLFATVLVKLDEAGKPKATLQEFHLGTEGVSLDLSGLGALLEPLLNAVISLFEQQIEASLASQMQQMLPGVMEDLFSQFELDQDVSVPALVEGGEPVNLHLQTRYSKLLLASDGIRMGFYAQASSTKKVVHDPLGALGRGDCAGPDAPPYEISTIGEVAVGLADDLLNQVLFAVWWGGALNLKLTAAQLGGAGETLEGYGIVDPAISLDFFLAPMLSDCNADKALRFGVGDLYVQASFKMMGQPITVGLFATLIGEASIALEQGEGGPSFSLAVGQISVFDYEIVSVTEGYEGLKPIIEELLAGDVLQGALGQIAGQSFGGIALPEIDLAGLVPGVPPGTKLTIKPTSLARISGNTELVGVLE